MTAPDVAALAAALHDDPNIGALTRRFGSFNDVWWERSAEAIIAVLAAQGWRITSAPAVTMKTASGQPEPQPAPDWQAAPGKCPDCGPYAPCPRHDESAQAAPDIAPIEAWLEELARDLAGPLGTDIRVERIRSALPAAFREYRNWGIAIGQEAMPRTQAGRDLLRAINEYDDYFGIILDVESQAVRAALDGLRAEVVGVWEEWGTLEVTDDSGAVRQHIKADGERITKEVLAIIDARLAALDA